MNSVDCELSNSKSTVIREKEPKWDTVGNFKSTVKGEKEPKWDIVGYYNL